MNRLQAIYHTYLVYQYTVYWQLQHATATTAVHSRFYRQHTYDKYV